MNSKVIELYKPFLEYIDSGKFFRTPFGWLYAVLAGFNLLIPLIVLYIAIDNQLFSMGAAFFFAFVIFSSYYGSLLSGQAGSASRFGGIVGRLWLVKPLSIPISLQRLCIRTFCKQQVSGAAAGLPLWGRARGL